MAQQLIERSNDGVYRVVDLVDTVTGKTLCRSHEPVDQTTPANHGTLQQRIAQMVALLDQVWASRPNPAGGLAAQTAAPPTNVQLWGLVRALQALARLEAEDYSDAT